MTGHVWHLPRLGCALQGLLPLLPRIAEVSAGDITHLNKPKQLQSECHLIDDTRWEAGAAETRQKIAASEGVGSNHPLALARGYGKAALDYFRLDNTSAS